MFQRRTNAKVSSWYDRRLACRPWGLDKARQARRLSYPHAKGFTLLELLVTVALMGMMVGIVANVLSQSSKLVTFSETKIRQNNAAYSLAQVLRDSLRKASKNGIIGIVEVGGKPRLILTTVGPTPSMTGTGKGDAAFTILGLVPNQAANTSDANTWLLWMPIRVLTTQAATGTDIWAIDFAKYQGYTRKLVDSIIISDALVTGAISDLKVPPDTIADVNLLWQVAGTNVSRLSVMWTDGNMTDTTPKNLKWYGLDINGNHVARDSGWSSRTRDDLNDRDPADLAKPEYSDGSGGYRALWTQANQNSWPRAIKIRFTFTDESMPPDFRTADYEVIGTIGQ